MARADKAADVAEIAEHFRTSNATVLTEYRGLTVAQLKTLRRSLGEHRQLRRGEEHADQDRCEGGGRRGSRRPARRPQRDRLHQGRPGRGRQGPA